MDLKRTYFPLCHPSFLRRLIFRLEEVTPVTNYWNSGYGHPSDKELIRKIMNPGPNDIIITQPSEIGISGNDINKDLKSFLKKTQLEELLTKV